MNFWTEKRLNQLTLILAMVLLFIVASNYIQVDYFITSPGAALELDRIITVEGGEKDADGVFFLTSVTQRDSNLFNYLYIQLVKPRGIVLSPKGESLPEEMDMEEYYKIMEDMMYESQLAAKYIALTKMGYSATISGHGAEIYEVMETSKAVDLLQKGDIIVEIEGNKIELASEAVAQIQKHKPGEIVPLKIKRDEEIIPLKVETIELEDSPGKASIGIYIMTYQREIHLPMDVNIATENIVGPSAGTMFTLEIINQLDTKEDLTQGYKIAGTGTMNVDGVVGPIDGVEQKIVAAEERGAQYFFSPPENYIDAVKAASSLIVVKIETIDDALAFLRNLQKSDN